MAGRKNRGDGRAIRGGGPLPGGASATIPRDRKGPLAAAPLAGAIQASRIRCGSQPGSPAPVPKPPRPASAIASTNATEVGARDGSHLRGGPSCPHASAVPAGSGRERRARMREREQRGKCYQSLAAPLPAAPTGPCHFTGSLLPHLLRHPWPIPRREQPPVALRDSTPPLHLREKRGTRMREQPACSRCQPTSGGTL